jgi:tetratricopeptide (TPR) repeat protein
MKKSLFIIHFLLVALSASSFSQELSENDKKFEKGIKYMKKYQRVQAQAIFDDIIKDDPNYTIAYYERAKINEYYKKDSLAIVDYTVVANNHEEIKMQTTAHTNILDLLFKNDGSCSTTAKIHISALRKLDPDGYKTSLYNGICKLHAGDYEEAISELTKAYNIEKEDKKILVFRARAEIETKNYSSAIEDLTKVITDQPKNGDAYFWRAYSYYELATTPEEKHGKKYFQLALKDLDLSIKYRVRVEEAYFDRAEVRFELGDYQGAISDFKKVISKNPSNMDARYQKAICYYHYGDNYYAIKELKYIIKKDSSYIDAYYDLAVIYYEKDDLEKSLEYADKTIKLDQEHSDAYLIRGEVKVVLKKKEEACEDFKKAKSLGDKTAQESIKKYCKR